MQLKECPFCGHAAASFVTQPAAGVGGVPRHRAACYQCGALSDFFDEFIHGADRARTLEKVAKAWNRRARVARSEELATHVGTLRKLLRAISRGCCAKTRAADEARICIRQMADEIDMILPKAKHHDICEIDVNRATR